MNVRSLTLKLIVSMGALQVIVCGAYFAVTLVNFFGPQCAGCVRGDLTGAVLVALAEDEHGQLYIRPSRTLAAIRRDHREFWYYVTDGRRVLEGGAVPQEARLRGTGLTSVLGLREGGGERAQRPAWASSMYTTNHDTFLIRARIVPISWTSYVTWAWDSLGNVFDWLFLPLLLAALVAIILFVRGLMRPIRMAARRADLIDFDTRGVRLSIETLPSEIAPLVTAVNAALTRLEHGYERQARFLANAAHELRTPLTVLRLQLAEVPECPARELMIGVVRRVAALVDQLLVLAQLEKRRENFQQVDLVAECRQAVADRAPVAHARGVRFDFQAEPGSSLVRGDATAIYSAVANLLDNAIAHSNAGQTIGVFVDAPGRVRVVDQGRGLPAGDPVRLFEPFAREDSQLPGVGLGLAIVREVMRLHSGAALAMPTPGGGATFQLTFAV
jgi:signal transduction histidine kinase